MIHISGNLLRDGKDRKTSALFIVKADRRHYVHVLKINDTGLKG